MKIFDIVEKRVILNENILLIPEFKAIVDKFKDNALDVFCFIYYFMDFKSPFADYDAHERESTLLKMFGTKAKISLEDPKIIAAMNLYQKMNITPTMELLDGVKTSMFNMARFLKTAVISDGKDGNIVQIQRTIEKMGPTIQSYDQLKEAVEKEIEKGTIRGGKSISQRER